MKFHEIPRHCYPQILYIPLPLGVVVLTDDTLKYKEFTVTCNTKMHYIRPLIFIISVSLQRLDFIVL